MNINKKAFKDAENENIYTLELYKNSTTGDIEYRTPKGNIIKVTDKDGLAGLELQAQTTEDSLAVLNAQVLAIPGANATTTVVNISSAQILAGGNIDILPAPGEGKYYDLGDYFIEPIESTTDYTVTGLARMYCGGDLVSIQASIINAVGGNLSVICGNLKNAPYVDDATYAYTSPVSLNAPLIMYFDSTPTLGNHSLRAIITYTTRTFGA